MSEPLLTTASRNNGHCQDTSIIISWKNQALVSFPDSHAGGLGIRPIPPPTLIAINIMHREGRVSPRSGRG